MSRADSKMVYELVNLAGDHEIRENTFTGQTAKQAALKLAKKLPAAESEPAAAANSTESTLRNYESYAEFVFEAWAWTEESSHTDEPWMPDEVTAAEVEGKQLDEPHEWFASSDEADQWTEEHEPSTGSANTASQNPCSVCGTDVPAEADFCPSCGTAMSPTTCPECAETVDPDATFCMSCGYEL